MLGVNSRRTHVKSVDLRSDANVKPHQDEKICLKMMNSMLVLIHKGLRARPLSPCAWLFGSIFVEVTMVSQITSVQSSNASDYCEAESRWPQRERK